MFESISKRGCQPFNWLVTGFSYPVRLLAGMWVDQLRQVDSPNDPIAGKISDLHLFQEDFLKPYDSSLWDENNVDGGGDTSEVCAVNDGAGGELTLTSNDSEDDAEQRTYVTESFKLVSGKKLWFEARAKVSAATEIDIVLGLIANEDLTAVGDLMPADGVVFKKNDGDTKIDVASSKDGTNDTASDEATLDTDYHRYGFYFDGAGTITPYIDGTAGTALSTTVCDDEELAPTLMVRAGNANARTLTVDYIRVVQER